MKSDANLGTAWILIILDENVYISCQSFSGFNCHYNIYFNWINLIINE